MLGYRVAVVVAYKCLTNQDNYKISTYSDHDLRRDDASLFLIEAMCCGKRRYTTIKDADDMGTGVFDKSLSWFGCGLGW